MIWKESEESKPGAWRSIILSHPFPLLPHIIIQKPKKEKPQFEEIRYYCTYVLSPISHLTQHLSIAETNLRKPLLPKTKMRMLQSYTVAGAPLYLVPFSLIRSTVYNTPLPCIPFPFFSIQNRILLHPYSEEEDLGSLLPHNINIPPPLLLRLRRALSPTSRWRAQKIINTTRITHPCARSTRWRSRRATPTNTTPITHTPAHPRWHQASLTLTPRWCSCSSLRNSTLCHRRRHLRHRGRSRSRRATRRPRRTSSRRRRSS